MGSKITHFCESLSCWHIDTGIFYLSGRDIGFAIIGFLICLIIWMAFAGRRKNDTRRNEN